jgi:peptidylprolyl isomerase
MIISPPELAYGSTVQQNIPANSTLVFVVDVLGVG